jgi:DNA-binding protein HU-beta
MSDKITFSDLVDKIAQETGASKKLIHDLLEETGTITKEGLERDGRVNISGLGHFDSKWHEARPGRNPQTGEEIEIPAHNTINFKATSELREYINRKYAHLKPEFVEGEEPVKTAIPPISTKAEPEFEHEYQPAPDEEKKSKKSVSWLWLIIPLVIIILALLLWPTNKAPESVKEEPGQTEAVAEDVTAEPIEQEQPTDQPEQIGTATKDNEPESDEQKKLDEETAPVKEDAVSSEKEPIPVKQPTATPGGVHSIQSGDKLWTIARDYYKQSYLWPNIYRVNLDKLENPDALVLGKSLKIPPLQGTASSLTKKDKKDIAEGFVEVYLIYKKMGKEKAQYYLWVVNKWEAQEVLDKYRERIAAEDMELIGKLEGAPVIK